MTETSKNFSDLFPEDTLLLIALTSKNFSWGNSKMENRYPTPKLLGQGKGCKNRLIRLSTTFTKSALTPPSVKIDKREALEIGKTVCPVVIEMYAEGLKSLMDQIPYIKGRYTVNTVKLKAYFSEKALL